VSDRTQSKQDKKAAKEAKKANAAAKQQVATQAQVSAQKTIRLKKEFINVTPPGEKKSAQLTSKYTCFCHTMLTETTFCSI
jgi:aspartyl-tRNA synthetase